MPFHPGLREFLSLLSARKIEFLVIGGVAYNHHAPPRATKDLDLWVRPTQGNVVELIKAIRDFGFPTDALVVDEIVSTSQVLMLGRVPTRIDLLTRPDGVDWAGAWRRRVDTRFDDVPVCVLSVRDLIASKRAAGRPRDIADVAMLEKLKRRRKR
ncbi:MAG: nucleotidyl transferase AbiEii/AbiGii toxin family protein [Planctomycetota bacterium]